MRLKQIVSRASEFSLHQMLRMIYRLDFYQDDPVQGKALSGVSFVASNSVEVSEAEIDHAELIEEIGENVSIELAMNDYVLTGHKGSLPINLEGRYSAQLFNKHSPLMRFLNVFNHKVLMLLHSIWSKYRFFVRSNRLNQKVDIQEFLLDLSGRVETGTTALPNQLSDFYCHFVGFFSSYNRSAENLWSMLTYFLNCAVKIVENDVSVEKIEDSQKTKLGCLPSSNNELGSGAILGDNIQDLLSRFLIVVGPINYHCYFDLLPNSKSIETVKLIVTAFAGSSLDYRIQIKLDKKTVSQEKISSLGQIQLGWSSWLQGDSQLPNGDDLIIVNYNYR